MEVLISKLQEMCCGLLTETGVSQDDAMAVFSHLLDEELLGKSSHGFYRFSNLLSISKKMEHNLRTLELKEINESILKINAKNMFGLVAANLACGIACKQTRETGFSLIALTGYEGTTGALGYYSRAFAKSNLISICMCTSEYAVAPWGGRDAILGTNPIAISLPNRNEPIIIDFATSAMTYGELMLAVKENRKVPQGIVLDENGNPSTDPMDAENGCQLPMAKHKGYALGLAIEVLAGLFIGAKSGKDAVKGSDGLLMISFKPDLFINENMYLQNIKSLIDELLSSELSVDSEKIRLPGENCIKIIEKSRKSGFCSIPDNIYEEILGEWTNRAN